MQKIIFILVGIFLCIGCQQSTGDNGKQTTTVANQNTTPKVVKQEVVAKAVVEKEETVTSIEKKEEIVKEETEAKKATTEEESVEKVEKEKEVVKANTAKKEEKVEAEKTDLTTTTKAPRVEKTVVHTPPTVAKTETINRIESKPANNRPVTTTQSTVTSTSNNTTTSTVNKPKTSNNLLASNDVVVSTPEPVVKTVTSPKTTTTTSSPTTTLSSTASTAEPKQKLTEKEAAKQQEVEVILNKGKKEAAKKAEEAKNEQLNWERTPIPARSVVSKPLPKKAKKAAKKGGLGDYFTKADAFMKKYVSGGRVAYSSINPSALKALVDMIASADLSGVSSSEKQAFYINAYNILVVKSVIDNNLPASPLDVSDFFKASKHKVAGKTTSLDQLEKSTLFGIKKDARFHFVLVCAAVGCPKLENFAYKPASLEKQLQTQTLKALNDAQFVQVDDANKTVKISKIFEWYAGDFGDALSYINKFRDNKIPADYTVGYYEYDWKLNKR